MSYIQTIVTCIPNQLIPFLCVYLIARTPAFLLFGMVIGYILLQQKPDLPSKIEDPPAAKHDRVKLIQAPPFQSLQLEEAIEKFKVSSSPPQEAVAVAEEISCVNNLIDYDIEDDSMTITTEDEIDNEHRQRLLNISSDIIIDDAILSSSSIDFENLMKFPPCPATLPRLDTHFNFVMDHDHDIKNSSEAMVDWSAIHQELEYDQQRHHVCLDDNNTTKEQPPQHPMALLHQLQQENLAMVFSDDEEEGHSLLSSSYSDKQLTSLRASTSEAAILLVDNGSPITAKIDDMSFGLNIEELLLLPAPPKPSLSSPGQLFKSKFQKAVNKIKKSHSHLTATKSEVSLDKRLCTYSGRNSKRAASLQLNSYFPSQESVCSNAGVISPRSSASARVHDHFKGRLNKLFKK